MSYKKTIISGNILEIIRYDTKAAENELISRKMKTASTPESKKRHNEAESKRHLSRLLNTNFSENDIFVTLTYKPESQPKDTDHAERNLTNFFRRAKRYRENNHLPPLEYIAVTENQTGRVHHHIIMSPQSWDDLKKIWGNGHCKISNLNEEDGFQGLAVYLTKEEKEPGKRRWRQSTNLKKPEVRTERIKNDHTKLYPPAGYEVLESFEYTGIYCGNAAYLRAILSGKRDLFTGETIENPTSDDADTATAKRKETLTPQQKKVIRQRNRNGAEAPEVRKRKSRRKERRYRRHRKLYARKKLREWESFTDGRNKNQREPYRPGHNDPTCQR